MSNLMASEEKLLSFIQAFTISNKFYVGVVI